MLFLLTGDIQTGKTRWLEQAIEELESCGVPICGVIAPGVWKAHGATFEKTGIDNVLLPGHQRIAFGRRTDLNGTEDALLCSQSNQAGLGWMLSDEAIARVDEHMADIFEKTAPQSPSESTALLIVDEIGRLELEHSGGLKHAVSLLERGSTPSLPHALAVVRGDLLGTATNRFALAPWNGMDAIAPGEESLDKLKRAVGIA